MHRDWSQQLIEIPKLRLRHVRRRLLLLLGEQILRGKRNIIERPETRLGLPRNHFLSAIWHETCFPPFDKAAKAKPCVINSEPRSSSLSPRRTVHTTMKVGFTSHHGSFAVAMA